MTKIEITHRIAGKMPTRTARAKKVTEDQPIEESGVVEIIAASVKATSKSDPFTILIKEISDLQSEFEKLQKEIIQTKEVWVTEQKTHQKEIEDKNIQEELERKRNRGSYEYETARNHKQEEDEFTDKKKSWERQLSQQQEILQQEKQELEELRKLVAGFEGEKEKSIKEAQTALQKDLTGSFENERRMKEQEFKAEKEILNLRLSSLTTENSRQAAEIQALKKALDEATGQVKEIAVKVIESGTKFQPSEFSPISVVK